MHENNYLLLDSGRGRKLERFGKFVLSRPCSAAVWEPQCSEKIWQQADAVFTREGENRWDIKGSLPDSWCLETSGIHFKISPTDFGHLGIFPEQRKQWEWIKSKITHAQRPISVLNLFAYSGGSTLASAQAGAEVCHLDASKGMVSWARENALLNCLENKPIRWIVDDAIKFLTREIRRGTRYDAIILDPPSFGRGAKGEVFKIEEDLPVLLDFCKKLFTDKPLFLLLSCHTPGFTPIVLRHLLSQMMQGISGRIEEGEMVLEGNKETFVLPSGSYARWSCE